MVVRLAFALASALSATLACAQDLAQAGVTGGREAGILADRTTRGAETARATGFAIAMQQYRHAALSSHHAGPYPLLDRQGAARGQPVVWVARDGSHVVRVGQGQFRLTLAGGPGGWFRTVECTALEWPDFACADGRRRAMSVPSNTRLTFGGTVFERVEPAAP